VKNIQFIVLETLKHNQAMISQEEHVDEKIKNITLLSQNFFATYLTSTNQTKLQDLPERVKKVNTQIANEAGQEVLTSSLRPFLGLLSMGTHPNNLIDLFLIQSMDLASRLTKELEAIYADEVLDKMISELD